MNIHQLKNIMKQVNEPNEFIMDAYDLTHSLYWIYKLDNVRVKLYILHWKHTEKLQLDLMFL